MKFLSFGFILVLLVSCGQKQSFQSVNSLSFNEDQITLGASLLPRLAPDSLVVNNESVAVGQLDELIGESQKLSSSMPDSTWNFINKGWTDFEKNKSQILTDISANSRIVLQKWSELNMNLLKLTGEVRFADALESLIYDSPEAVLSESTLKSVIYTHVYDQIFVNLFGSSSLTHQHTTGGTIKLTQETKFPESNEIILSCECSDTRYLDVFIRIPVWAVNPTVNHGNVKYVARPGEYCQISRKWKNGDVFVIQLKN